MSQTHTQRHRSRQRTGDFTLRTASTILLALPSAVTASVSLSSFSPSASNLTPACSQVYTSTIPGCTTADFSSPGTCSQSCLDGLVYISTEVYAYCTDTQDYQLLIAQFLNGNGISVLCPGVIVVTAPLPPSSIPPATSFTRHTHLARPPTTKTKGTSTVSRAPVSTGGLFTDTSPAPCVYSTCTQTSTRQSHHHTGGVPTSKTHRPQHTQTHRTRIPPHSTTSESPSISTSIPAAASSSQCVSYGGDPFSDCAGSDSNGSSGAPAPLHVGAASLSWLLVVGVTAWLMHAHGA